MAEITNVKSRLHCPGNCQAAELLPLHLARKLFSSTHPSLPHSHTHFPPLCRGKQKHLRQVKNDAERPQETCTLHSAFWPHGGHTFSSSLPHKTNKNLGKDKKKKKKSEVKILTLIIPCPAPNSVYCPSEGNVLPCFLPTVVNSINPWTTWKSGR